MGAFFLALLLVAGLALPAAASPKIVYKAAARNAQKRIAITFDDGPHPRYTPEILDILAKHGAKATFFAVGVNAETYPHIIRRILAEGHELGNHTYNHYHTQKMECDVLRRDILACSEALRKISGSEPLYFRPPEGVCTEEIKDLCRERGYTIVMWSIDTRDWAHTPIADIVKNVQKNAADGAIILMHDFIGKNSPTPAALRQILPILQEAGFEFVTVSELLAG